MRLSEPVDHSDVRIRWSDADQMFRADRIGRRQNPERFWIAKEERDSNHGRTG